MEHLSNLTGAGIASESRSGAAGPAKDSPVLAAAPAPVKEQDDCRFEWKGLRVRYHPNTANGVHVEGCQTTLVGIVGLRGFSRDNALVERCYFEADESVPVGQVILEPLS